MKGKTRDGSDFQGKKYIYFCSHPDDREYYLKEITEDIQTKKDNFSIRIWIWL